MSESEQNRRFYQFGNFRLYAEERLLMCDGERVPLTPRVFNVLLMLVEHQGEVLTKEKLLAEVWADTFVEEGNLSRSISMLRRALAEQADEFPYIETVPKVGYRFIASVRAAQDGICVVARENYTVSHTLAEEKTNGQNIVERAFEPEGFRAQNDIELLSSHPRVFTPPKEDKTIGQKEVERALEPEDFEAQSNIEKRTNLSRVFTALALFTLLVGLTVALAYLRIPRKSEGTKTVAVVRVRSIAVLPFKLIGAEDDDEYLRLGMADALITKLSNQRQITVRSLSSVRKYTDVGQDPVAIGRELQVDATLEGNVQRLGDRVRVTVQLLSVSDGTPLWAEKFDGEFTNFFSVQDRISEQAAQALMLRLSSEEKERLTKRYTENGEAQKLYLKGRHFWNKRSEVGFRKAIEHFNQAVNKDPNYALAHAGLADCYLLLGIWGALPPNEAMPKAKEAAMKALKADDLVAEAHASLAFVKWVYDWDFAGADEEFKRAIQANPHYTTAYQWRSYYLASIERFDEAIVHIKRAQELEGSLSLSINTDVGEIYCWARQYDKAIEELREVIQIEPNFAMARNTLGMTYIQKGQVGEAIQEMEAARFLDDGPRMMSSLGYAYAVSGQHDEARKIIRELKELSKRRYVSSFAIAIVHAGLSEEDEALAWLEKAYNEHSDAMVILKVYPLFDGLRENPRFVKLQQRVGLTP